MATTTESDVELLPLDTSDVECWIGRPLGGPQLKDPLTITDIRAWALGMQNPNPRYFDDDFAAESEQGEIVAPQSFAVTTGPGHGAIPAIQGTIEGSHMLFGGDEWWFYGPRIRGGDRIHLERLAYDYRVTNTSFAGPTMFQRGDTTYINQRGEVVAKQRSTAIRYLAENAQRLASLKELEAEPEWSDEELEAVEAAKFEYYHTFQHHVRRTMRDVSVGETLPTGVIGPHSLQSFTTEWRSYINNRGWGTTVVDRSQPATTAAGWLPEMSRSEEKVKVDPAQGDGLNHGASRGHVNVRWARLIGMPRAYGYGASMGAWCLDYVSNWAGELGFVVHSGVQYRNPALVGDVTYLDATVSAVAPDPLHPGHGIVTVALEMKTQAGTTMARGPLEVRLPDTDARS